jgi:CubicO group peptidase (beta-lactamase class C family)
MTALLAALLVERGVISWTNKVIDSFPDWKVTKGAREITLEQLLVQKSGLPYTVSDKLWEKAYADFRGKPRDQRIDLLTAALQERLESVPGKKFIYSNTGYALAGAMLEKAGDRAWEDLVREQIFRPLYMTTAGFGPPSFPALVDQPWGHQFGEDGQAVALPRSDNPVSMAPAGAAHCSILDFAQYVAFHLAAAQGKVSALSRATLEKLYSPPSGTPPSEYAMGWMVMDRPWAGGKALTHAGSNKMFYSLAWICPVKNRAFVVATNIGDKDSSSTVANAADEVIAALVERFLGVRP